MSDTPTNGSTERHLDERIRALVATAVADAPPAPDLEAARMTSSDRTRRDRGPWLIAGTTLVGAAAAVVAALVINTGPEDASIGPAAPSPAPSTTASGPGTTIAVAPPTSMVSDVTASVPPATEPGTTAATATTTPATATPAPASPASALVATDGDVISLWDAAGAAAGEISQAADVAFSLGDGRVLFQRRGQASDGLSPADSTPYVWTGSAAVPLALAADDTEYIEVHDVAMVGGRPIVLYTTAGPNMNPDTIGDMRLWAADIDGGEASADAILAGSPVDLGVVGGWEASPERLHLASSGLVVGALAEGAAHRLFVTALPGSPAAPTARQLTPGALGLEEQYADCTDCPRLFAVDGPGTTLAWVDGTEITTVAVGPDGPGMATSAPVPVPTGNLASIDLVDGGGYLVTYYDFVDPRPAARLVTASGRVIEGLGLDATWAPSMPG